MSDLNELNLAKIEARKKLNILPSQKAQEIVNEVIYADMWQPNTSEAIKLGQLNTYS